MTPPRPRLKLIEHITKAELKRRKERLRAYLLSPESLADRARVIYIELMRRVARPPEKK
jgi:hypothetical protein